MHLRSRSQSLGYVCFGAYVVIRTNTGCLNNKKGISWSHITGLSAWKCSNLFFQSSLGWYIYDHVLSVLTFRALGHAHSAPKWILDMTHISSSLIRSGKKEQSTLNFELFFFIKFMKIPQNFIKIPQNFMKKSHFSIKEEEIWVISRIHFGALWGDLGHEN